MVLFSLGVIGQKVPLVPQILVFRGIFKYFLPGFAILLGLLLKPLGLGAELNFSPNPGGFSNNPTTIVNSDSKYLENPLRKSVFSP
jgi:hypothetical protein